MNAEKLKVDDDVPDGLGYALLRRNPAGRLWIDLRTVNFTERGTQALAAQLAATEARDLTTNPPAGVVMVMVRAVLIS